MTTAMRSFIFGFAAASILWLLEDPPLPYLVVAMFIGFGIGLLSAAFGDVIERFLSRFGDHN